MSHNTSNELSIILQFVNENRKIKDNRCAGLVDGMRDEIRKKKNLIGKPEGKRPSGKPRRMMQG
jgi:hypothetical protein